jgi:Spy/CpxP family protein refolding chaperone
MKFFNKTRLMAFVAGTTLAIAPFMPEMAQAQSPGQMFPLLAGIELTQQQQAQWSEMRSQTRSQIERIIRPEQINAFRSAINQGQTFQQAIAAVNLSNDQKAQLRQVFQASRKQTSSILTAAQKQQLMQNLRSKGFQRFGNR